MATKLKRIEKLRVVERTLVIDIKAYTSFRLQWWGQTRFGKYKWRWVEEECSDMSGSYTNYISSKKEQGIHNKKATIIEDAFKCYGNTIVIEPMTTIIEEL